MEAAQKRVTKIERAAVAFGENQMHPLAKRRVAAYARVSTDSDEQFTSFEAQVDYYTRQINANPDWTMVEVYTDVDTFYGLIPKSPSTADFSVVHGLLFGLLGYRVLN